MGMEKKGVDLAKWNAIYSYEQMKADGVEFAVLKVINMSNNKDSRFLEHYNGCKSAGIPIIAGYTYSYANTVQKAKAAAAAFLNHCPEDIPVMVLDLEDSSMTGLGEEIVDIINIYREAAVAAGKDFIIYTGASFYNPCLKKYADRISDIPIWWARYPSVKDKYVCDSVPDKKYLPNIANEIVGWQYSSKGTIAGARGYIDLNVWYREEGADVSDSQPISADVNPFAEPTAIIKCGTVGEGAKWVQWYLWRFGLLLTDGVPDVGKIDGIINAECEAMISEAQRRLGLNGKDVDGKVGPITKALFKKTMCF